MKMKGLYKLHATHGFSLTDSLMRLRHDSRGLEPDWNDFVREAQRGGWSDDRITRIICEAIEDSGWQENAKSIIDECLH